MVRGTLRYLAIYQKVIIFTKMGPRTEVVENSLITLRLLIDRDETQLRAQLIQLSL